MRTKNLTLRIPEAVYRQVAEQKHGTATGYIVQAIEEKLARDRDSELKKGFACLAGEPDDESSGWIEAQKEAMKRVDG